MLKFVILLAFILICENVINRKRWWCEATIGLESDEDYYDDIDMDDVEVARMMDSLFDSLVHDIRHRIMTHKFSALSDFKQIARSLDYGLVWLAVTHLDAIRCSAQYDAHYDARPLVTHCRLNVLIARIGVPIINRANFAYFQMAIQLVDKYNSYTYYAHWSGYKTIKSVYDANRYEAHERRLWQIVQVASIYGMSTEESYCESIRERIVPYVLYDTALSVEQQTIRAPMIVYFLPRFIETIERWLLANGTGDYGDDDEDRLSKFLIQIARRQTKQRSKLEDQKRAINNQIMSGGLRAYIIKNFIKNLPNETNYSATTTIASQSADNAWIRAKKMLRKISIAKLISKWIIEISLVAIVTFVVFFLVGRRLWRWWGRRCTCYDRTRRRLKTKCQNPTNKSGESQKRGREMR